MKKRRFKRLFHFSYAALTAGLLLTSASPASAAFWGASNELLHDPTMVKEGSSWYAFWNWFDRRKRSSCFKILGREKMERTKISFQHAFIMVGQLRTEL